MASRISPLWICILIACSSALPPHPVVEGLDDGFSIELVEAQRTTLDGLFPRIPGSQTDSIARGYLEREFGLSGADVRILEDAGRRHMLAEVEGRSTDVILLVAAYPALESSDWIDDSGVALMLELARVLAEREPAYTLEFALADVIPPRMGLSPEAGRKAADAGAEIREVEAASDGSRWQPIPSRADARTRLAEAGESLARAIEAEGRSDAIRAVIVLDVSNADPLRIARDLRSHPGFRAIFWKSAADLGFAAAFPEERAWDSPESLHLGFLDRGMDRVLALVEADTALDGTDARAVSGESESLGAVGPVTLEALGRLVQRFEKVDAFAR